ncbi:MAG: hypothetical protein AB4426_22265 [Xenococcaceae cyanobacterium]
MSSLEVQISPSPSWRSLLRKSTIPLAAILTDLTEMHGKYISCVTAIKIAPLFSSPL